MKKLMASLLTAAMVLSLAACGGNKAEAPADTPATETAAPAESEAQTEAEAPAESEAAPETEAATETAETEAPVEETPAETAEFTLGAMSGPTAMGMVKLLNDMGDGSSALKCAFNLGTDAAAFVAPLAKGELDIACIPSNLASVVYNNTEGQIVVLATCNTGVLHVVERGEAIQSMADLAGKTVYMTGQGAVPEYTVRYLLSANEVDPDNDVTITWCADTTEVLSYVQQDENAIAIVPQPFATVACAQVEGLHIAVDLNEAWNSLDNGCNIITGVVVARKAFVEENPETVKTFMAEYAASVDYVNSNVEEAAQMIADLGIVPKAPIAQKALPGCNLVCMTGDEMKTSLSGFLQILFDQNPKSVGGNLPAEDFYYAE